MGTCTHLWLFLEWNTSWHWTLVLETQTILSFDLSCMKHEYFMSKEEMDQCTENRTSQQPRWYKQPSTPDCFRRHSLYTTVLSCNDNVKNEEKLPGFSSNQGLEEAAALLQNSEFQLQRLCYNFESMCSLWSVTCSTKDSPSNPSPNNSSDFAFYWLFLVCNFKNIQKPTNILDGSVF